MQVSRATFEMVKDTDIDADLSYLGVYKNTPSDKAHTVDRQKRGDMQRNEFRYFIATNSGEETGNRLSVGQDYKRCEAYNRGDWCMVYIRGFDENELWEPIQRARERLEEIRDNPALAPERIDPNQL